MIDVIIPVFNRPEYVSVLIENLYSTNHGTKINPIFVDNGSRKKTKDVILGYINLYDGLTEATREQISKPTLISLDENKGFAAAVNKGMEIADPAGKAVILHNDCIPFAGWVGEMEKVFEGPYADEVAVVIPRTNYANEGTPCIREYREKFEAVKPNNKIPVTSEEIFAVMSKTYPEGRDAVLAHLKDLYILSSFYSAEISSFCMMIKTEVFNQYGKFDEEFWPRGYEDKYWFQLLERDGYICNVANYAYVHHFGNITSDGPGFSFPDVMKMNEERYNAKTKERDKNHMSKTSV